MSNGNHVKNEGDVIVFLEPEKDGGGKINPGLLTEGARIAALLRTRLCALTIGPHKIDTTPIEGYGVSVLYCVEGEGLADKGCNAVAWAVGTALERLPFRLLLLAHSDWGADLAPLVAAALGTVAVTDCADIRTAKGTLSYVRHVYGDQLEQVVSYEKPVREIATIRTEALDPAKALDGRGKAGPAALQVVTIPVEVLPDLGRTHALPPMAPDFKTVDIAYAERIIGVGSGSQESLALVEELSDLLGAAIGTTRVVVDDGLIPKKRMIGQTGKTVSPGLYLALGVSGSPHHVAGIQGAKELLSVNSDPGAPIFGFSDKGFIGDLRGLLPKLIDRIKRYRDGDLP